MKGATIACLILVLAATPERSALLGQALPQVAQLGRCDLVSGQAITDCRVAYRTFGSRRSDNVVLIPTWLGGKSADWTNLLGPAGLVDTTDYFVVVMDALGNGTSSSPSNTAGAFPGITIEDMVRSQYRLVREELKLTHVRAVVGVSMGGIQTFEWSMAYPEFADRFVSIVGTQRAPRWERAWLGTVVRIIEAGARYGIPQESTWRTLAGIFTLTNGTQESVNATPPEQTDSLLDADAAKFLAAIDLADLAAQSRAVLAYDAEHRAGAVSTTTAKRLDGRFLVINSPDDRAVSAEPAFSFARRFGANTLAVRSTCGHGVFTCEAATIGRAIGDFVRK